MKKLFIGWLAPIMLMVMAVFALSGCETVKTWFQTDSAAKEIGLQIVVYTAVDSLVQKKPEYRERIIELADKASVFINENPEATASVIVAKAREDISWNKLTDAEVVVADTLLKVLEEKIAQRLESGKLQDGDTARVMELIDWVKQAALVADVPEDKVGSSDSPGKYGKVTDNYQMSKVTTCKVSTCDVFAYLLLKRPTNEGLMLGKMTNSIGSGSGDAMAGIINPRLSADAILI